MLLDENLPHDLRTLLTGHDVRTVAYQGWKALRNGELIQAAEDAGFDVVLTADRNMRYQQNIELRNLAIVVLDTNKRATLVRHVAEIERAVDSARAGEFISVELPQANGESA